MKILYLLFYIHLDANIRRNGYQRYQERQFAHLMLNRNAICYKFITCTDYMQLALLNTLWKHLQVTVNLLIFASVIISRLFKMHVFRCVNRLQNLQNHDDRFP